MNEWVHSTTFLWALVVLVKTLESFLTPHWITTFRDSAPAVFLPPFSSFPINPSRSSLTFTKIIAFFLFFSPPLPICSFSFKLHIDLDILPFLVANLLGIFIYFFSLYFGLTYCYIFSLPFFSLSSPYFLTVYWTPPSWNFHRSFKLRVSKIKLTFYFFILF